MSTFRELQERLAEAKERSTILEYLVEHIDSEFRSVGGATPKRVLMTADKLPVPEAAFEGLVLDLVDEMKEISTEVENILGTSLVPVQIQGVPVSAPIPAPVVEQAPQEVPTVTKKSKRGTTQGDVQS